MSLPEPARVPPAGEPPATPVERILVVDDEGTIQYVVACLFREHGHEVECAGTVTDALRRLEGPPFSVALLDIVLPDQSGTVLLGRIKERSPETEVIMMTSHASAQTAIEALRQGAYDYVHKPFELDELVTVVTRAAERRRLAARNRELLEQLARQNVELRGVVRRLKSLNAAGVGMSGIRTLAGLLDFFVELVAEELEAERVSLMQIDPEDQRLRIVASRGIPEEVVRDTRIPLGEGVAGRVARDGTPLLVQDVADDPRFTEPADPRLKDSFVSVPIVLSVPIRTHGAVLGVINVTNRTDGRPFDGDDEAFLTALAGQAAVAIERATHSERLAQAYASLQATQDQLLAAGRLGALGQMAAGVAHDFNNVLNGILGRSELIAAGLAAGDVPPDKLAAWATTIRDLAHQGAGTVRRIQEFTRIRRDRPTERMDLNDIVRQTVRLTEPRWREQAQAHHVTIRVVTDLREVPAALGEAGEMSQVLSNLVFNAVDAMPEGGLITVATESRDGRVVVRVTDTGCGMSEATRQRLFEPFFTTKPHGQGLGMSVVYGIVQRFGGEIVVESEEGRGTSISILLSPVLADTDVTPQPGPAPPARHGARVLVIDDEGHNLELCQHILERHGHEVVAAASGSAGLERLRERGFDLVITDLGMPGLTGWDVAREVKASRPGTPVILLSGWGVQQEEAQLREAGVDVAIPKPVGSRKLLDEVQRLLAA